MSVPCSLCFFGGGSLAWSWLDASGHAPYPKGKLRPASLEAEGLKPIDLCRGEKEGSLWATNDLAWVSDWEVKNTNPTEQQLSLAWPLWGRDEVLTPVLVWPITGFGRLGNQGSKLWDGLDLSELWLLIDPQTRGIIIAWPGVACSLTTPKCWTSTMKALESMLSHAPDRPAYAPRLRLH